MWSSFSSLKVKTHQVTWFRVYCLRGRKRTFRHEWGKTWNMRPTCTHWVWDVAYSVHPDFPTDGEGVNPVQRNSVLVFQQVSSIYRHLQVNKERYLSVPHAGLPSSLPARTHRPWRRLRAPGWSSRRGRRACRAAGGASPLCPSSPAAGSCTPHRASPWSEGWSGGRRQSAVWCCSHSTGRSETCTKNATV